MMADAVLSTVAKAMGFPVSQPRRTGHGQRCSSRHGII